MAKQGNLNDQDVYKQGIYAREELSTTGIGEGIAIAHAQSEAVNAPGLAAMVVKDGVDYQSLDNQPAKLFFMIAVPKTVGNEHLQILAMLSQMLMDTDFKDSLINAQCVEEFMDLINQKEAAQKAKEEEKEEAQKEFTGTYRLLAVTACVAGSAVAGALSMFFNCTLMAPHGGIFVIGVISNPLGYLFALAIGSVAGMFDLALLKKPLK